jgi:small subunit ribosomal protein S16
MLKIRLQRTGKVNDPYFRVIVTPHTYKPKTGKPVEIVGNFDVQRGKVVFDKARIEYWMSQGAQASPTVYNMLLSEGVVKGEKAKTLPRKKVKTEKK